MIKLLATLYALGMIALAPTDNLFFFSMFMLNGISVLSLCYYIDDKTR